MENIGPSTVMTQLADYFVPSSPHSNFQLVSLPSRQHSSGCVRHPCKGHGIGCLWLVKICPASWLWDVVKNIIMGIFSLKDNFYCKEVCQTVLTIPNATNDMISVMLFIVSYPGNPAILHLIILEQNFTDFTVSSQWSIMTLAVSRTPASWHACLGVKHRWLLE